ncbi:Hypothetical predicted protein [Xyrichtys novacula]|uniref:Uncharacterized protein n=1 Tax=Xyrichtys novacula TaxID=13765 RepID=A0AAV1EWP0_XYRNO|nr:Hypothetical predicted protein [Xyrichtys novacula]
MSLKTVLETRADNFPISGNELFNRRNVLLLPSSSKVRGQRPDDCTPNNLTYCDYCFTDVDTQTYADIHEGDPEENIPQQQRAGRHEHPEETTLTSCQIKPSRRLLGLITADH